jgi:GT2 family glycosyltransferase
MKPSLATLPDRYPKPDVSIVIVTWNTRAMLEECLLSLCASTLSIEGITGPGILPPPGVSAEVWVVDNASSDGTAGMVRERFPWVRLVENPENLGFARGNNLALAESSGRYAVLLNSDTQVEADAITVLIDFLDATPQSGAAGPMLLNSDGTLQTSCTPMLTPGREFWRLSFLDLLLPRSVYVMANWSPTLPRPVEVIKGACLAVRKQALDEVGVLDDSYFMYTEEVDLCYRLASAGWTLWWVPASRVIHHGEASSRQARAEMYLQLYRSKLQFFRKTGGEEAAQHFRRLLRIAYWPRLVLATLAGPLAPRAAALAPIYERLLAELPEW